MIYTSLAQQPPNMHGRKHDESTIAEYGKAKKSHVNFVDTNCGHSGMPLLIFFARVTVVDRIVEKCSAHIALMALILTAKGILLFGEKWVCLV